MAETPIAQVRCQVFVYDGANWSPRDSGVSTVAVYHNPSNNMYRVVGLDGQSGQANINSVVWADLAYQKASAQFHQWTDQQTYSWGLNFATPNDAETFAGGMARAIQALKGGYGAAPPTVGGRGGGGGGPGVAATVSAPVGPPQPPPAPKPPAAPAAPPAPKPAKGPAAAGGGGGGGGGGGAPRGALLSSITGFSKGGLKKTETVDKSSPLLAIKAEGGGGGGGGGGGRGGPGRGPPGGGGGGGGMMAQIAARSVAPPKVTPPSGGGTMRGPPPSMGPPGGSRASSGPSAGTIPAAGRGPPSMGMSAPPAAPPVAKKPSMGPSAPAAPTMKAGTIKAPGNRASFKASGGGGSSGNAALDKAKEDIINTLRGDLDQFKRDILQAMGM